MKNRSVVTVLLLLLTFSAPTQAQGQVGAIIDWINGLSGPRLVRFGPEITFARLDDRNQLNLAGLLTIGVGERGNADTEAADIKKGLGTASIQATLESILFGNAGSMQLRSRLGFEVHWFSGEFDTFVAPSFPALLTLHKRWGDLAVELGTGFNIFSFDAFTDDAFSPYDVGVATSGFDAGWTGRLAVEWGDFALIN